ncbi:MAG: hypothetical protein L0Y36_04615, partial [Planctomycetales bacterium]|nr:hypothetical protein [Planctomycetales bacterium]
TFLRGRLKSELEGIGIDDATEFIVSVLREGYFRYAIHDDDEAAGRENMAQEIHAIYQRQMGEGEPGRMGLPPMNWLRYQALYEFLNDPMYPEHMRLSLIGRIQLERPDLYEKLQNEETKRLEQSRQEQQTPP